MGSRPLRQYYDGVTIEVDDELPVIEPWLRHRRRLTAALAELTDDQWKATTRCTRWDARGVVGHLVTVDAFWVMSLRSAHAGEKPTTFIRGFDPSTGTDDLVAPLLDLPPEVVLEQFVAGTETLVATVESLTTDDWSALAEAPFGHMPARLILAHALWDSWLHERDILGPLGLAPPVEADEVLAATWYTLIVGGLQGGLLDDAAPVGSGPDAPIEATLRFTDLADEPLHVRVDTGVRITRANETAAVPAGSAVDLVESVTGRVPTRALHELPSDLAEQLGRAAQIL
jgi:uncharacterized protein (TIGR03083 family)